jgi:hypothetical protein
MVKAMSYTSEKLKVVVRDNFLPGFLFRWRAALNGVPEANLYSPTYRPWGGELAALRRFALLAESAKNLGFLRQTTLYNDR